MRSLREFIKKLEELGDLATVKKETDSNLETAAITAMSYRQGGPALQFSKIKGFPNYSLVGGLYTGPGNLYLEKRKYWRRAAIGLDMDPKIPYKGFQAGFLERRTHKIFPLEVAKGPCKEEIITGKNVDITKLPIPMLHQKDGGRYNTLHTLIVKDLDTDWVSWTSHRVMVIDGNRLTGPIPEESSAGQIYENYKKAGKPMPFAIAIGAPPAVTLISNMYIPKGESPAALAGGVNLDPIELVKAETNALFVPSQSEIIIEGEVSPKETSSEGPFPAYWFYEGKRPQPVYNIKAITKRKDAIIPFSVDGVKPSDTHNLLSLMISVELQRRLIEERNIPVFWTQMPLEFNLNVAIVCAPMLFHGLVLWISRYLLSQSRGLGSLFSKVIVVDERTPDISLEDAINDVIYRCHPNRGYHFTEGAPIGPNMRCASAEQKRFGSISGLYLDTGWPKEWTADDIPRRVSLEGSFPKALLEKVAANYKRLGFKGDPVVFEEAIIPF